MATTFHTRQFRIFRLLALISLSVVIGLAFRPPCAAAGSPVRYWSFSLGGTHGYRLDVTASRTQVDVFVDGRTASTEYVVPARSHEGVVEADIGRLGKIEMNFVPSGPRRRSDEPNGCHGPRPTYQEGHVEGTFRFRGEGGFTAASTHHASAVAERGFDGLCQGPGGELLRPNLVAREKSGHRTVTVSTYFREFEVSTHAEVIEKIGNLDISRYIGLAAPLSAASIEPDGSASISPPSPFFGSALYATGSSGPSWTGDLGAVFPGIGAIRLAGPRFEISAPKPLT